MNSIYLVLFILSILIASFSQIILKKGASKKNIYINRYTIIGYGFMLLSTILTLVGYKGTSLTMSGILQSLSFVFVPLFSFLFLKEKVNKKTMLGIAVIIVGIIVFSI